MEGNPAGADLRTHDDIYIAMKMDGHVFLRSLL